MAAKNDPLGYYAALNVSPGATHHEIRLGYKFIKEARREGKRSIDVRKVQEAYDVLSDPKRRAAYDRGDIHRDAWWRSLRWIPHGLIAGVVLFVVLAFQVWSVHGDKIRGVFQHFEPGAELVAIESREPLGTVIEYRRNHQFPNGKSRNAYQVRPADGTAPRWYPATDIDRYFESR